MKYDLCQLKSCAANSIENLVRHNACLNLIVAMQKSGLTAYIALDHENEGNALDSARIRATARTPVYMRLGICIERVKERTRGTPRSAQQMSTLGMGKIGYPVAQRSGLNRIRPMRCDFTLDRAVRVMKQGDYIQVFLSPAQSVIASNAFDEATNQHFVGEQCFHYVLAASSTAVAIALIDDIARSQADFCLADTECDRGFSRRINCSMMTRSESILLAKAVDTLLSNMLKPDIDSLMDPGTVQSFGRPEITVGFNNGMPVGFGYKHLLQNVAILGAVYSGKSKLQASVIRQLHDAGIPCLVVAPVAHQITELADISGRNKAGFDHIAHEQVANPPGILTIRFVALLRFGVFGMSQGDELGFFKDVEYGNPVFSGRFHTNLSAGILIKPDDQIPKAVGIGRKARFPVFGSSIGIRYADTCVYQGH